MGGLPRIIQDREGEVRELCLKHKVRSLSLFGSGVHGDFDEQKSDFDFLVEFSAQERGGLDDVYFRLMEELSDLLGRRVDLVEVGTVRNPYVLRSIESAKVPVYDAA